MKTKKLVTTAMLLAMAVLLSLVQVLKLPFGGSVTLVSMLPVVLIAYMFGTKWGLFSAFVYSLLQMLTGMDTVTAFFMPGDSQMALGAALCVCLIDYVLAYTMLGFGGIFKGKFKNGASELVLGVVVALGLRYLMHIISGAIFFGAWADWFFGDSTGLTQVAAFKGFCTWVLSTFKGASLSVVYSIVYNGCYMIPEMIITVIVAPIIYKVLEKSGNKYLN